MKRRGTYSKSKIFFLFCFCFLCGVSVASLWHIVLPFSYWLSFSFVGVCLSLTFWSHWRSFCIVVGILLFGMGIFRYQIAFPVATHDSHVSHLNNTKGVVRGYVAAEPDIRQDSVKYIVSVIEYEQEGKTIQKEGNIYVSSSLYPRFSYGDELRIRCSFRAPLAREDFRYDMYMARYGVFSICSSPIIEKIAEGNGNPLFRYLFFGKEHVAKRIRILWHEPYASFMAGLLYGYRGGLGSLNELFSKTGVTHIVAISGYNITIISSLLLIGCLHCFIPRKKAFFLVVGGIIIFVLFAGASASVVRAGIMGIIVLFARQLGRSSRVHNVMILTATCMIAYNPFLLMFDAGFQLSFLSTLGLVYIAPLLHGICNYVPAFAGIRESFSSTVAATLATLPLIVYQFGRLSLVSIVVNVLILWILPFIMAIGFFSVCASFVYMPLAQGLAWLAFLGMAYIVHVVSWFASYIFAAVSVQISVVPMILAYLVLLFVVYRYHKKISL